MAMVTRRPRHDRRRRWLTRLIVGLCISGLPLWHLAAAVLTEYEVKAGFLYHFGWFVEWPATTFQSHERAFIIGVLGANPFGGVLNDIMQGKTIRERPGVVKYYQRVEDAAASNILFISAAEEPRLPAILAGLDGTSVLTVSDIEHFAERGGMIALRIVDRKVHFDINMNAVDQAGLKLSSQLLRLAKVVHGTPRERE
jgi:hypothetical protein